MHLGRILINRRNYQQATGYRIVFNIKIIQAYSDKRKRIDSIDADYVWSGLCHGAHSGFG